MTDRHKTPAKTIRLEPADWEALARIKELYGCPSDNAAVKLALRMVARLDPCAQAPDKERHSHPHS